MRFLGKTLRFAAPLAVAVVLLANPPREDLVSCPNCGAMNEPSRTSCRNCSGRL